jgi:hypothetical protein
VSVYRIADELTFKSVESDWMEGAVGARRFRVPVDAFKLALEFASPRDSNSVFSEIDAGCTAAEFDATLTNLVTLGVLVCEAHAAADETPTLESFLRPELREPTVQERMAMGLQAGNAIVIKQAFVPELAEAVYAALDANDAWTPYEGYSDEFHFRHHNLYHDGAFTGALRSCKTIFDAPGTKEWISAASDRDCRGPVQFGASWYMPGDYSLPHTDFTPPRAVAFIWHLTREWAPRWGGSLYWCPRCTHVAPEFNTLTVFNVSSTTWHFVCPVSPRARGKRLAVNGWWTTTDEPLQHEGERRQSSLTSNGILWL